MTLLANLALDARIAAQSLADYVGGGGLRLGVTGLSRAGKTVFITSLVHHLVRGGRLPVFRVHAEGRLTRARVEPQPDDAVPRFAYEDHVRALTGQGLDGAAVERHWPQSTRRISEIRITLEFERKGPWRSRPASLPIDIVDYPGEWLLDLPLLTKTYAEWSRETLEASNGSVRAAIAVPWRTYTAGLDPTAPAEEGQAQQANALFTAYLRECRQDRHALSTLPPGRFLMPGDLEGTPALTFAPLLIDESLASKPGTLAAMMERRYESYKRHVVRPFFRDHFARLDRQIVLIDALAALNSGPAAVRDLETALAEVLMAFRAGRSTFLSTLFAPRIDRILFAATKADHLHHTSHDRLEAILRLLAKRAIARAEGVGARVDVIALAAARATREVSLTHGDQKLDAIVGTPLAGETIGGETFDGTAEVAVFPGQLPENPEAVFRDPPPLVEPGAADFRSVRFRPPLVPVGVDGRPQPLPHIRLDRALEFLMGDKLT